VPLVALFIGALGCAPEETQDAAPEVDLAAALASLHEADANYARVASARDLDGWMAVYAEDARMYPPERPAVTDLASIRTRLEGFVNDPNSSASFQLLHADVSASGDMGHTMNLATTTGTGPDGDVISSQTRDFHVWRRLPDGSWRIVVDMWAPAEPAASM